jgi:aarF domain-containing kinase
VISNRTVLAIASSALISGSSLIRGSLAECNTPILVKENDHEDLIMAKIEHKLHPKIWQSYWEWLATILARLLYMLYNYSPVVGAMPLLLHPDEEIREYWWKIFVKAIQRGGPCSIKLAQWASTRTDLFPEIVCRHFRDLQSNQDDPDWREITKVFEKHYGPSWSEKLQLQRNEDGQIKLLGGGCVAKVLFGKLQSDDPLLNGSSIAVKVIHHNIKKRIVADTELLRTFAEMLEYWFPSIQQISLLDSVEEFSRMMLEQVDMRTEARSLDRFRQNFNEENKGKLYDEMLLQGKITNHVHFPAPYWEYTNEDVLVETYTPGYLIRDYMVHADAQHKKEIANIGLHTIFKMIFLDNFIHADLHPGNIVLLPAVSSKPHLAFIDAGLAVELKKEDRRNLVDLFKAVIINDGYAVGRLMIDRSRDASKVIDGDLFAHEMKAVVNEVHTVGLDLGKISISNLLQRVLMLCYQHQVKLEPRYATVIIALGVVEGLGRQLDPDVDILKRAAPYVMKASLMLATEYFTHKS